MSYQARKAADTDPRWSPGWFDPLGRDRVRREAPAVEVIEERKGGEGVVVTLITRNAT